MRYVPHVIVAILLLTPPPAARTQAWPNCQDLSDQARYRTANAALPVLLAGEQRVVFIGDSITEYLPPFPDRAYINRGIAGQVTPQMLIRFRADVVNLTPTVVVILAGLNDIGRNFGVTADTDTQDNLASMCDLATTHRIAVVLSSVLPVSAYHGLAPTSYSMTRIRAMNDWIKQYAREHRHGYVDYFAAMIDSTGAMRADLTEDDIHPNAKGYEVMAPLVEAAIQRTFGEGR